MELNCPMPKYLSLAFILEEGLPIKDFWEISLSIKKTAEKAGVQIVAGDTKVVEKGKGDKIFINTSGIGAVHPQSNIRLARIQPTDCIILSGNIASHDIAIMTLREDLSFDTTIESDTPSITSRGKAPLRRTGRRCAFLRDATRGGVASVMNEIAQDTQLEIEIEQSKIVIKDEVAGACEMLGLDPLYVANKGMFLAIVGANKTEKACLFYNK